MCGIAGILNPNGACVEPHLLWRMIQMLGHRGPDDSGVFTQEGVGLGHARLSIIDLDSGRQPMHNLARSSWIVFNGEIFNYVELAGDLVRKGHRFATKSDTEVILQLYEEYGTECVQRMNGQWAFALWDARRKRLFLSRDRVGVRPLFYSRTGATFIFASEIKALLAHPAILPKLDLEALRQTFTYWSPISPRTAFQDIFEVPPGHSIIVDRDKFDIRRYWQLDYSQVDPLAPISAAQEQRHADELKYLLLDATRLRLRSDVPVGAYVSGGLDSSIVTALAQKVAGSPVSTFSVEFDDGELDESHFQDEVVRALGTTHRTIRCGASEIADALPEVIWHTEQPILRTAPAPMYLLSKLVRESGFKVVLTGEGSDEFQGGYDLYKEAKIRAFWARQIDSTRRPLLLRRLYPYMPALQQQSPAYLQALFQVQPGTAGDLFFSHRPRWQLAARTHQFFSAEVRAELRSKAPEEDLGPLTPAAFATWDSFSRAQYLEATILLPGYLLSSQGDRVAMAHSVEARYPFLDHRVVELSTRIPPQLKMKVLKEKYLLKKSLGDMVPASVRSRPKQPYRAPDATSLFDPATGRARSSYIAEMFSAKRLAEYGIFNHSTVQRLVEKAKTGMAASFVDNAALVGILSTQVLMDKFVFNFKENVAHGADRAGIASVRG